MSPELAPGTIRAERIWKRFRPDRRESVLRAQVGRLRDRLGGQPLDWHWALRDVSVHLEPGDSVGLVGNNGSGKSTLLKILARVMYPYAGRVGVAGRVGALIEVKAGIHPELTGQENVHLYGMLLGLGRRTIAERFDDIVSFAQLEDAIDRQVKFYSSGMQMRLGFAVAAFLEPELLLVDEVLAVGDAAFQQRCLERMRTVLDGGTTLIYVSHDLATVEAICTRGVLMDQGVVASEGPVSDVLADYRRSIETAAELGTASGNGRVRVVKAEATSPSSPSPTTQEPLDVSVVLESDERRPAVVYVGVSEGTHNPNFVVASDVVLADGQTQVVCHLPRLPLPKGRFFVWLAVHSGLRRDNLLSWRPIAQFDVMGPNWVSVPMAVVRTARFHVDASWDHRPL